jgi:acetyl-CoA acetyltransferase
VYCCKKLELDPTKVNVNGGAIALGHPLGATGIFFFLPFLLIISHKVYLTKCVPCEQPCKKIRRPAR